MTVHYVEFAYPGIIVSETSSKVVDKRDAKKVQPPKGCYAFRFFDRTEAKTGDETLIGKNKNHSAWYYVQGSRVMTLDDVKREMPDQRILISNMENNGYKKVIRTIHGQCMPAEPGDRVLGATA